MKCIADKEKNTYAQSFKSQTVSDLFSHRKLASFYYKKKVTITMTSATI